MAAEKGNMSDRDKILIIDVCLLLMSFISIISIVLF